MKMRLVDGFVADLSEDPEAQFHPTVASEFEDVPESAPADLRPGYAYDGQTWTAPVEAPPPSLPLPDVEGRKRTARDAVNADRNRRIRQPFGFASHRFDYDDDSQKRITGAAALAGFSLTLGGKQPGDLRWHGGETDFAWIDASNALVPMDAVTCFAFGQAAAAWESAHVFAARALKEAIDAAPDAAALDRIDLTAGWPE